MNTIDFLKKGSGIHIKEKNKGKFTKSAKAAGLSVQEHAKSVLNDPNATPLLKKRANFARNAAKWKHLYGGNLVDTRSDTTRLGYHEGTIPYGASLWNGGFPLIDIYNAIESKSNTIKNNPFVLIGIAPTPGRIKVSNVLNKNLPLTKKVNSSIKSTATYIDGDKRHLMSGLNRYTSADRERARLMIVNYYPNSSWYKSLKTNQKKFFKLTDKKDIKKSRNEYNAILDDFIENSGFYKEGGIIPIAQKGIKAGLQAKQNLTKRKDPDWDNLDRGYRYLTQDKGLSHDLAIAIMGNIVEESQGNYKAVQKNGGGRGLIQWDGLPAPSSRYGLWGKIWASVAKPANVYDKTTDTVKNYWGPYNGLKGEQVRLKFIKAPLKEKVGIYSKSYLRPGNPRNDARVLSAMQLDSIYNPKIKNIVLNKKGGIIKALEGIKTSWWLKGLDFLNSDSGKGILNLGSNLISGVINSSKASDYGQNFDNATNATVLAMLKKQYAKNENLGMLYALLYLDYLNKVNPDQHFGEIDKQRLAKLFAKSLVNEDDINEYKLLRALEKALLMLAIQGSGGTDWLSLGLGLIGSFLGPKKTSSTTDNNSNTLGKSTNPYMYTGLGGYLSNPSLA